MAAFSALSSSLLGLPPQRVACACASACFSDQIASFSPRVASAAASSAAAFSAVSVLNADLASAYSVSSRASCACRSAQNFVKTSSSARSVSYSTMRILAALTTAFTPCGLTSHAWSALSNAS